MSIEKTAEKVAEKLPHFSCPEGGIEAQPAADPVLQCRPDRLTQDRDRQSGVPRRLEAGSRLWHRLPLGDTASQSQGDGA